MGDGRASDDRRHSRRRGAHRGRRSCARRCWSAAPCREIAGCELWLKFENLQFTAAYKERGALNKLLQLTDEERARGVIAASAGNHAQAVAYHAKRLGIPATIVMPEPTPTIKVTQTAGHGAEGRAVTARCSTTLMPRRASLSSRMAMSSSIRSTITNRRRARGHWGSKCSKMRPTSTALSSRSAAAD